VEARNGSGFNAVKKRTAYISAVKKTNGVDCMVEILK
jgi:hypothetical protein